VLRIGEKSLYPADFSCSMNVHTSSRKGSILISIFSYSSSYNKNPLWISGFFL
jgi:hypothetical protein